MVLIPLLFLYIIYKHSDPKNQGVKQKKFRYKSMGYHFYFPLKTMG